MGIRKKAKERGLKTYFSGKTCKRGHLNPERRVNDGSCIQCEREYKKNNDYYVKWKENNKEKYNEYHRNYRDKRLKSDIIFKLSCALRNRLKSAIKRNYKAGSTVSDLGCSIDEFKIYIEQQFKPEMSWDNWGLRTWHLDHIRPLTDFDLTDRRQFLEACHFTNLQPLHWRENLIKGNKCDDKKLY